MRSPQPCAPDQLSRPKQTAVVFLKTHKTAGSTVQNILFRFAERHNVTVALPGGACGERDHQFCYPRPFSRLFVHPLTRPPGIVASHLRPGLSELRALVPTESTFITIVREPASMFESLFSYYGQHCASFRHVPNHSIAAFLRRPAAYYRPADHYAMYARNSLIFDLGGDPNRDPGDEAYLRAFILGLESVFSLVMVAEHFDESLVLLRRLLAWDLEDVTYVRLNARSEASRTRLAGDLPEKARRWNWLDARLYQHFNATLWRKLRALGLECVERELGLLRQANRRLSRDCFGGAGAEPPARQASQIRDKDLRPWQPSHKVRILGYELPRNLSLPAPLAASCLQLITPEVSYSRQLLKKAATRARARRRTTASHLLPTPSPPPSPTHPRLSHSSGLLRQLSSLRPRRVPGHGESGVGRQNRSDGGRNFKAGVRFEKERLMGVKKGSRDLGQLRFKEGETQAESQEQSDPGLEIKIGCFIEVESGIASGSAVDSVPFSFTF
ncbi:galactose-3-O-sulfotransferase 3-like [Heterodontus francisci]|uniref:galactose-3-O-sulfotransferase 3-like n=1 Tax=Heterodontus francisci TaxID=7792 RepID=UPI00355AE05A